MAITLDELVQNRNDLIEAHRKNNFTNGIRALLTDLYPDTAHFIYELLQNAEDMNATVVRFVLGENGIDFEHNGTKRTFNIADIDAITNIGHNSQKKDDPTSIGKFGVGFKAVFAYTATPIIHSGDYHFKIKDYFVPEFKDVRKVSTTDRKGVSWTKFSFPFNNPQKPAENAFEECINGLKMLDSSAVLFLQNIRKIEYMLPSSDLGYVERIDGEAHHVTISYKKPADQGVSTSKWLRFHRMVDITDDQEMRKRLPIAVAFALEDDSRTKKEKIVPAKGGGRTFIYFPAEKEHSGLRFHINAPFASTVARDSVRNCDDNKKLIKAISQLIVDNLPEVKTQGLMNHAFFEVLPNNKDELSFFYQYIFDYIYVAFQKNEYVPTKEIGYVSSVDALMGPPSLSNLIKGEDLKVLTGIEKKWIANASQKNSHADNFIQSLGIETYTYKDFAKVFEIPCRSRTEQFVLTKNRDWLKRFYLLCADAYDDLDYLTRGAYIRNIKQSAVIRSSKESMHKPGDIFILPPNTTLITKTTPVVEQSMILGTGKADRTAEKIKSFFQDMLNIREYGPKIEIEKLLQKYEKSICVDDDYFKDLLAFAKYSADHNDIDFASSKLFLFLDESDNVLYITNASKLYLGSVYGNNSGDLLAETYGLHCIWKGYAEHYKEKDLQLFISFVSKCGINKELEIVWQRASRNPLFYSNLYSDGKSTSNGTDSDYTIPELERLLGRRSVKVSKLIWNCLLKNGKGGWCKYTTANYAPNGSIRTKTCDSTLIHLLKQNAWIPDRQGKLRKPEDITVPELQKGFVYDSGNKLLEALKFGSAAEKQNLKRAKAEKAAKEAGMRAITEDEYQQFEQLKAQMEAMRNVAPLSGQELLKKQQKKSVANVNEGDDFSSDGAVNNVSRRETSVEATFRNAKQMKPAQRKLFARIAESTKEERRSLKNWYQGKCQMCNTRIMSYNQAPHFVAKNIINTRDLSSSIRQTTSLAWNSVCLCPNCAAKYTVCSRDLNGLFEQIMQTEVIEGDAERIVLTFELDGKQQEIHYVPKHFLALRKVMQLIEKETSN